MALSVHVSVDYDIPGLVRVYPVGSLDSSTANILEEELAPLLDGEAIAIVLDLSELTFLTSAGLRVIVAARKRMAAHGGVVVLANPQPQVAKVFDIIKALPGLNVFESVKELDEYLAGMQRKVIEGQS